jgi:hypothetical protein
MATKDCFSLANYQLIGTFKINTENYEQTRHTLLPINNEINQLIKNGITSEDKYYKIRVKCGVRWFILQIY